MGYLKYTLILWGFLAVLISCSKDDFNTSPPVLSIAPIDFSMLDTAIVFGEELGPDKKSPALEYIVHSPEVSVNAMVSGDVETIVLNEGVSDYELRIRPSTKSNWLIIYDHVLDVTVSEGDPIQVGDILGKVGVENRTEIQVNERINGNDLAHCPLHYASSSFIIQHQDFISNWCLEDTVIP